MLPLFLMACTGPGTPPVAPVPVASPEPASVPMSSADSTLVAAIRRNGTKACKEGEWSIQFHGLYWQAGWVDLLADDAMLEPHHGTLVQLGGAQTDESVPAAEIPAGMAPEHCPVPQMRSDMVETPDGIRYRRGIEPSVGTFRVATVAPFTGLTATTQGDETTLRLENTLGTPLSGVQLHAHYEGCYGKPGTQRKSAEAKRLEPGATLELAVPMHVVDESADSRPARKGGNARTYRLAAVLVSATGDDAWITIDVAPEVLGVSVPECPN